MTLIPLSKQKSTQTSKNEQQPKSKVESGLIKKSAGESRGRTFPTFVRTAERTRLFQRADRRVREISSAKIFKEKRRGGVNFGNKREKSSLENSHRNLKKFSVRYNFV